MKKVALAINYNYPDYGGMLQAYATHYFLNSSKIENIVINLDGISNLIAKRKKKYFLSNIFHLSITMEKFGVIKKKIKIKLNKKIKNGNNKRVGALMEFSSANFNVSKQINSFSELTDFSKEFDAVVVGSDQLWLPSNVIADYYTLNFVSENTKRICYATSFGVSSIPKKYVEKYRHFLTKFDNLSARELSGKKIIKDLVNRDVDIVCDPTLLVTRNEWNIMSSEKKYIEQDYIFCYFMGNNPEHRKLVKELSKKTGYKIVALTHLDSYLKCDNNYADYEPYDVGPMEFVNLVKNAKMIFTDSFHGTVFSLIFNKEFYTFKRFNKKAKLSTNTRLESLLSIFDLKGRYFSSIADFQRNSEIDYTMVNDKIANLREKSIEYLLNSINGENENE